jgi:hypothetical protein
MAPHHFHVLARLAMAIRAVLHLQRVKVVVVVEVPYGFLSLRRFRHSLVWGSIRIRFCLNGQSQYVRVCYLTLIIVATGIVVMCLYFAFYTLKTSPLYYVLLA